MNVSDSERVATSLASQGYTITADADSADVVLINTCSVREKAEQKLYTRIGRLRKDDGKMPVVGVLGCVAQLEGETLFKKNRNIDFVIGTKAVGRVADAIKKLFDSGERTADLAERDIDYDWSVSEGQRHSPYVSCPRPQRVITRSTSWLEMAQQGQPSSICASSACTVSRM